MNDAFGTTSWQSASGSPFKAVGRHFHPQGHPTSGSTRWHPSQIFSAGSEPVKQHLRKSLPMSMGVPGTLTLGSRKGSLKTQSTTTSSPKTFSSPSPGAPPGTCRGCSLSSAWKPCTTHVPKSHCSKPQDSCHRIDFNSCVLRRCFVGRQSFLRSLSRSLWLSIGRGNKDQRSSLHQVSAGVNGRALGVPDMHIPDELCHLLAV